MVIRELYRGSHLPQILRELVIEAIQIPSRPKQQATDYSMGGWVVSTILHGKNFITMYVSSESENNNNEFSLKYF
jgi:hypothetical protein